MPSPLALTFKLLAILPYVALPDTTSMHTHVQDITFCMRNIEMQVTHMQYCHHIDNAADRGNCCSKYHHSIATSTYYATLQNAAI